MGSIFPMLYYASYPLLNYCYPLEACSEILPTYLFFQCYFSLLITWKDVGDI